jgi:hypothetical protein
VSSPRRLDELGQLDRSLLHLFVAGPGYGEAVAVALPERGWLLVDGCSVDDDGLPLRSILERWRGKSGDDPIDCHALTRQRLTSLTPTVPTYGETGWYSE